MIIDKKYQIEQAASDDFTRPHLHHMSFDAAKGTITATTGQMLAVVPVETEEGDVSGAVTIEALKAARKAKASLGLNGSQHIAGGASFPRPTDINFPPYEYVIPSFAGVETVSISFDPALLMALAKAIGCGGKKLGVTLTFNAKEPLAPIRIDHDGEAFGVLMPMRA